MEQQQEFKIFGTIVTGELQKQREGLIVEALDKDLILDDRLGSATTNQHGYFEIVYQGKDFKDVFFERKPDIFLRVKNKDGKIIFTSEQRVKYGAGYSEHFYLEIPEVCFEQAVESERFQFKKLVNINPNYFGNITDDLIIEKFKPIYPLQGSTRYEELKCVGLLPDEDLLEAILEIKRPYGYKGGLCKTGSTEFVAFYIDYGEGFISVGAPAQVNVHDLFSASDGGIRYAVRKPFNPLKVLNCKQPQIVRVRAILSWEKIPGGPDFKPVWGNVIDAWVQIRPKKVYQFTPIPFELSEIPGTINLNDLMEKSVEFLPEPDTVSEKITFSGSRKEISELMLNSMHAEELMLQDEKIEKERSEFKKLISQNPNYFGAISESKDKEGLLKKLKQLSPAVLKKLLPKFEIDPDFLIPVKPLIYNTTYEELTCVGLYPEEDLLEATLAIKKPSGYSGGLCTLGSNEYVAFFIDWGDGSGYKHIATTFVNVHDIPEDFEKPIHYAVKTKIPDIQEKLKNCNVENIVKVKAILSWNTDPAVYGENYKPAWGNVLTGNIQIRPKNGVKCSLEIINEVHTDDIDKVGTTTGQAIKINDSGVSVPFTHDRPFGGVIAAWGNINVSGAAYYRFSYNQGPGSVWKEITDKRRYRTPLGFTGFRSPDPKGWFNISDYMDDKDNYPLISLIHWNSTGLNGLYNLKLELSDAAKNIISGQEFEVPVYLDNKGPELMSFGGTNLNLPASGVVVKDDNDNYRKCSTFIGGETIKVYGNFKDAFFKAYSLVLFGGNVTPSGISIGSGRYDYGLPGISDKGVTGAFDGGNGTELKSLSLCSTIPVDQHVKCAYGIRLYISDRAIVGHIRGYEFDTSNHGRSAFTTFDWDPKGC